MVHCEECNKKVIMFFACKCTKTFCIKHLLPEIHKCEFKEELFKLIITPQTSKINII
jgi:predicted nucleic acid binding AN1-type Zn finger protein